MIELEITTEAVTRNFKILYRLKGDEETFFQCNTYTALHAIDELCKHIENDLHRSIVDLEGISLK